MNLHKQLLTSLYCLLLLALSIATLYAYTVGLNNKSTSVYNDYGAFYASLKFAQQEKSLYTTVYCKITHCEKNSSRIVPLAANLNPPLFSLVTYPLGYFNYVTSYFIWVDFSILCGILSILLLQKILAIPYSFKITIALLFAFFIYIPTYTSLFFGQVSLFILLLLLIAWNNLRNHHFIQAAIILGITAALKPFLGLFVIYFLVKRQYKALFYFCASGFLVSLAPILFFGYSSYLDYYKTLQHITWFSSSWNASLLGFFIHLLGSNNEKTNSLFHLPQLSNWLYWFFSGALIVYLIKRLNFKYLFNPTYRVDLEFSLLIIIALLISPLGWIYYFSWLIIPFSILLNSIRNNSLSMSRLLLVCLAILFSNLPSINSSGHLIAALSITGFVSYLYPSALLLLAGIISSQKYASEPSSNPPIPTHILVMLCFVALLPSLLTIFYVPTPGVQKNMIKYPSYFYNFPNDKI